MSASLSVIEQAARRLEELRRSGIDVRMKAADTSKSAAIGAVEGVPARVARMLEEGQVKPGEGLRDPYRKPLRDVSPVPCSLPAKESSRHVDIDLKRLVSMGYLTPETPRAQKAGEAVAMTITNCLSRSSSTRMTSRFAPYTRRIRRRDAATAAECHRTPATGGMDVARRSTLKCKYRAACG